MPKSKAVIAGPGDVEMNAKSSSGTKNAMNDVVSTVIRSNRTRDAKRKAISAMKGNKESKLNSNKRSFVSSDVEAETSSASTVKSKRVRYIEPTLEEIEAVRGSSRVQSTYKATEVWVKAIEEFRSDVGYEGKIEEIDSKEVLEDQLSRFICAMKKKDGGEYCAGSVRNCMAALWRHLNQNSVMPKPVEILNPKVYFDLNTIVNGKLKNLSAKGLGERSGSDGLTLIEVEQILSHHTMQRDNPEGLLRRVFFYNSILLALRGGEHQDLCIDNFVKRADGGIDVKLYRSKTNQRGISNYDGKAEVISLPNIKSIIDDYEFYFVKRPVTKLTNFYLSPVPANTVEFSGQWYYGRPFGEKKLRTFFRVICESTDISFGGRSISNHSGRKTAVQVLKELGYSDAVVMSITRHKSQKGLAAYERPKTIMQQEGLNGFLRALTIVNNGEGQFKENEKSEAQPSGGFKRASSLISLAGGFDDLEIIDVNEPPGATTTDEPPGSATTTDEPPGSVTTIDEPPGSVITDEPQPQARNVLGEIEDAQSNEKNKKNRNEFVEKFLTGNTFNNCVFHF